MPPRTIHKSFLDVTQLFIHTTMNQLFVQTCMYFVGKCTDSQLKYLYEFMKCKFFICIELFRDFCILNEYTTVCFASFEMYAELMFHCIYFYLYQTDTVLVVSVMCVLQYPIVHVPRGLT